MSDLLPEWLGSKHHLWSRAMTVEDPSLRPELGTLNFKVVLFLIAGMELLSSLQEGT